MSRHGRAGRAPRGRAGRAPRGRSGRAGTGPWGGGGAGAGGCVLLVLAVAALPVIALALVTR